MIQIKLIYLYKLIYMNNNNKFNLTHHLFSKQLLPQPNKDLDETRFQKTSVYFRRTSNFKKHGLNQQPMFHIQPLSSSKIDHNELIQNMKVGPIKFKDPIGRLKSKQTSKAKSSFSQRRESIQKIVKPTDTKLYWQRYLNEQISHNDLTKQLNKNFLSQSFRGRSKSQIKNGINNGEINNRKIQKSAFYVNNFLRKRKNYLRYKQEQQKLLNSVNKNKQISKERSNSFNSQVKVNSKMGKISNSGHTSKQHIMPWEKSNQGYQDSFSLAEF